MMAATAHALLPMKRFLLTLALFALSAASHGAGLPADIATQLPPGYEPMAYQAGPQIEGGRRSMLVVAHRRDDSADTPSPRPLLIFEEQASKQYRLAAHNETVVLRANEGGQCDPFDDGDNGLAVKGRYFTVQNGVACGAHWTDFITFRYDAERRAWLFDSEILTSSDPLNGTPDKVHVTHAKRAKPVSFEAWRPVR
ncbi:hypothetical protein [Paraburkholderia sp. J67]|uniref:hypothetical protein n=1 Tax=Paraburkholderia sp. J67 TaxID=2805435 RepID=UPI002ABD3E0E|nr:hypothetical protein [Paraburkholderia sp. J67]